jgi:hypothetical protein
LAPTLNFLSTLPEKIKKIIFEKIILNQLIFAFISLKIDLAIASLPI